MKTKNEKRDLLIKAAKAAGIPGLWNVNTSCFELAEKDTFGRGKVWNPISNNSDAFLLALKLKMDVDMDTLFVTAYINKWVVYREIGLPTPGNVRKAIVRVAAGEKQE